MEEGRALAEWFSRHGRDLPWRREPRDPYAVLVSELMLQQTQVDRVVGRFEAFLSRFPSIEDLARAREEDVLAQWSGLGYYRRARMLHRLARTLVDDRRTIPDSEEALRELPGIGPYTAAAIASLAFRRRAVTLDGNVRRVAARFLGFEGDVRSRLAGERFTAWVLGLMEESPPATVNEALMELGATVCTPARPRCSSCPIAGLCAARRWDAPDRYPKPRAVRAPEDTSWIAACVFDGNGRMLVTRVSAGPILRGLWLPPWMEAPRMDGDDEETLARSIVPVAVRPAGGGPEVRHTVTYRRIRITPFVYGIRDEEAVPEGWRLVRPEAPGVPTSSLLTKLSKACEPVMIAWKAGMGG